MVSKHRPKAPILAITQHEKVLARLCLLWGVIPVMGDPVATTDEMFASSVANAKKTGLVADGDQVVISAGVPISMTGATNLIKVLKV